MISNTLKEYLKVMYVLQKQNGSIRVTDIANKMNCSKPNVTKQLNILKNNNLIEYETYGHIELTKEGIEYSKKTLVDEDIVYLLLNRVIGIDDMIAKDNASKIKSVIDEVTLNKISNYVYKELELDKLKCDFNINNEKCRDCIINKGVINDRIS